MKQVTRVGFNAPPELVKAAQIAAVQRGMTLTQVFIVGAESLLTRYAEKDPQIEAAYEKHLEASGHYARLEKLIPESKAEQPEPRTELPKKGKKK